MNEKTLKFGDVVVNKKEFCDSKKQISLNFVGIDRIVGSDNFKQKTKVLDILLAILIAIVISYVF